MAGHSQPVSSAMYDVASNLKLRLLPPPQAVDFLDYVRKAADVYGAARAADEAPSGSSGQRSRSP